MLRNTDHILKEKCANYSNVVIDHLNMVDGGLNKRPLRWPVRSTDLSPLNYFEVI